MLVFCIYQQMCQHQRGKTMTYILVVLAAATLLVGCQTTPSTTTVGDVYQGSDLSQRSTDKTQLARVRTALAAQYIGERKLDDAQRQLEIALRADPRYAPAHDMMGNLLSAEGSMTNLQKADEFFRKAIAIDPNFVQARNNYGVYLSKMNRYQEAIEQFKVAGSTLGYEGRVSALENLGLTYLKTGHEKSAEEAFNRALDTDPETVVARLELIDILINQKRTLQAKEYHDELKALWQLHNEPLTPRLLYQGIRLSVLQNNPQERQRLSTMLLSQHPLSDEAKKLKTWLSNPAGAPLK